MKSLGWALIQYDWCPYKRRKMPCDNRSGCLLSDSFPPLGLHTPGFPVHHLLELAQTHVHWVSDAIQPFCPLSPPSSPTFNLSQHWRLFYPQSQRVFYFTLLLGRGMYPAIWQTWDLNERTLSEEPWEPGELTLPLCATGPKGIKWGQ